MSQLYIAYGSNMNLDQMKYRCPKAKVVGKALLKGYELEFRSVATIVPNKNEAAPVLIWDITKACEEALDRYEGYPNLYRKEYIQLDWDGELVEAMVYIMNREGRSMPSQSYYDGIKEGYITAEFGQTELDYLASKARKAAAR